MLSFITSPILLKSADKNKLKFLKLNEWWHEDDKNKTPRLITFLFEK